MEGSSKRKRNENEDNGSDEADVERFIEIVENFRVPYDWFRARMPGSSSSSVDLLRSVTNGDDRKEEEEEKKKKVGDDSKRGDVWRPCFVLEDFDVDEVVKFGSSAVRRSEATTKTALETINGGGEEKKKQEEEDEEEHNEELDLRLSL